MTVAVAIAIACAPAALYFLMHHNHDNGHCGWSRCQAGETT